MTAVDEYFEREVARLRDEWEAGNFSSLMQVVMLLADARPLPMWAADAVVDQFGRILSGRLRQAGKRDGKRGRSSGIMSREAQDDVHKRRWDVACWALGRIGAENPKAAKAQRLKLGFKNKGESFARASEVLRGTSARGSASAIEESYKIVENSIKKGEAARFRLSVG